jgi:hypothetical protein
MRITPTFEQFCSDVIGEPITAPWVVFYRVVDGLALDEHQQKIFRKCTNRDSYEPRVHVESTGVIGRRGEKTSTALKFLLYKSQFAGWERQANWFARATHSIRLLRIPIIAQDLRVCGDIMRTAQALVLGSPMLAKELVDERPNELVFRNGTSLICLPASKASVRGLTCPAALLDELAFVSVDGASDVELVRQVKPSMIQFGDSRRLIKLSTPWRKSGILYEEFSYRNENLDPLVWQASTSTMTDRIPHEFLEKERAADPACFAREYEALFTEDVDAFVPTSDIDLAVGKWREQAPRSEMRYVAALDASGLSGGDRFTFGIASEGVIELMRGWRRAAVPQVLDEIVGLCKAYSIRAIVADQYSFTFLSELFRQRGVKLEQLAFSARSKPEIFFDLKNALAQGEFQLPNHAELLRELRMLESTRTTGGSYKICAPRGLNDDFVCVAALLPHKLRKRPGRVPIVEWVNCGTGIGGVPRATSTRGFAGDGPEHWWNEISN